MNELPTVADFQSSDPAAQNRVHAATMRHCEGNVQKYAQARNMALADALDREQPLPAQPKSDADLDLCATRVRLREGIPAHEAVKRVLPWRAWGTPAAYAPKASAPAPVTIPRAQKPVAKPVVKQTQKPIGLPAAKSGRIPAGVVAKLHGAIDRATSVRSREITDEQRAAYAEMLRAKDTLSPYVRVPFGLTYDIVRAISDAHLEGFSPESLRVLKTEADGLKRTITALSEGQTGEAA